MKAVILGASGQVGSVIYNGLKNAHDVVGTSRNSSGRFLKFDPFTDDWSLLGHPDILINCVGQIDATQASSFYDIHVEMTKQIIAHRAQLSDPRIIQISALGASAENNVEFLRTKGIADDLLLQHENTAIIRPSIVCTHHTMTIRKVIMLSKMTRVFLGVIPVPKGFLNTRIQPIMPEDLLSLVEKACIDRHLRIVEAVGPEAISFREIIDIMIDAKKQKVHFVEVPKRMTDLIIKNFISRMLPGVINAQQYQLLFHDNVGSAANCEKLLGRKLTSTKDFFRAEFESSKE